MPPGRWRQIHCVAVCDRFLHIVRVCGGISLLSLLEGPCDPSSRVHLTCWNDSDWDFCTYQTKSHTFPFFFHQSLNLYPIWKVSHTGALFCPVSKRFHSVFTWVFCINPLCDVWVSLTHFLFCSKMHYNWNSVASAELILIRIRTYWKWTITALGHVIMLALITINIGVLAAFLQHLLQFAAHALVYCCTSLCSKSHAPTGRVAVAVIKLWCKGAKKNATTQDNMNVGKREFVSLNGKWASARKEPKQPGKATSWCSYCW